MTALPADRRLSAHDSSEDIMSSTSPALSSVADKAVPADTPPLRRLPLRNVQPPFDDELDDELDDRATAARLVASGAPASGATSHQGALKLAFTLASGVPAVPELPAVRPHRDERTGPALRLVPPIAERPRRRSADDILDEEFGPRATPRELLPDPTPWAGRLVQAVVEAMAGVRPVAQLIRWTTTEVYDGIQNRAIRAMHERRGPTPRRLAEVVRSVHVSEPVDGVAEVCAIVQQGPRCRAIALRLEGADGRWRCTALQLA
jgi:hypothetical protein